ncbi:unnamed protein product [marine sediment metagenome]|uniref:Uncharacterized protein n=1 Tax=marine sediment metagenome TaxID=412755 RepID=X1LK10_9ZZZZ
MSNLISATLSPAAMQLYKEMQRGEKSRIISKLIVEGHTINKRLEDLTKGINERNIQISRVIWELKDNPIHRSLCTDLNELLIGTIHHQYD